MEDQHLWDQLKERFENFPAQLKVASLLLERGFQVTENGDINSGGMKIAHTLIAREAGVERKAVDNTVDTILSTPELKRVYTKLTQGCLLHEVAHELGMSAIGVIPESAFEKGMLAKVTEKISEKGLNILQAFAEHPYTSFEPKLIIVFEGKVPAELIPELRMLPGIRSIIVY